MNVIELSKVIARLRRTQPLNNDTLLVCGELEKRLVTIEHRPSGSVLARGGSHGAAGDCYPVISGTGGSNPSRSTKTASKAKKRKVNI
jgi:hypothetical protein